MDKETVEFILKLIAILIPMALGYLKIRDMVIANRARIVLLEKEYEDLKQKREKDLIEHSSVIGIATSIEAKFDNKMNAFMKEVAKQRHEDTMVFNKTLGDVRETLAEINSTMRHLGEDVSRIKNKHE